MALVAELTNNDKPSSSSAKDMFSVKSENDSVNTVLT